MELKIVGRYSRCRLRATATPQARLRVVLIQLGGKGHRNMTTIGSSRARSGQMCKASSN